MNTALHAFSQRDPRWALTRLGASDLTLGEAGCLITATASALADWGIETDPARLNAWLTTTGGYAPPVEGGGACRLVFQALLPLGARLRGWVDCYATPANLARVARGLAGGQALLALIDARPGEDVQAHWVRLLATAGRDCLIMDPWQRPGAEVGSLTARYGGKGWDAGRAIFAVAGYERVTARRAARINAAGRTRTQPVVCRRSGEAQLSRIT